MQYIHRVALVVLMLWFALELGCSPPPTRIQFNDKMAYATKRLTTRGDKFRSLVTPMEKGTAPKSSVRAELSNIRQIVEDCKRDAEAMKLPGRGSENAPAMKEAYDKFLAAQQAVVDNQFRKIAELADNGPGTPQQRWPEIKALLEDADKECGAASTNLKAVQKKYAEEHFLRLVAKRTS